jgi:hypothetical protein
MLERLLRLLANGEGSLPTVFLARSLGVSDAMLGTLIDELMRMGYVEPVQGGCSEGACAHCAVTSHCPGAPSVRLWRLTEKGRTLARK